jgi:hypothetical protein
MKKSFIILVFLLLTGCSTRNNIPITDTPDIELTSIKEKYVNELAKIQVGDYIAKVASLFPEMSISSDTMKNTQYEFDYHQPYFPAKQSSPLKKTYTQTLRFYFVNKKLVHWGVK